MTVPTLEERVQELRSSYLGETPTDPAKYATRTRAEWALAFIARYGQIDGAHHKQWVLDQVARILHGAPVTSVTARWKDGQEEDRWTVGSSRAYEAWVLRMRGPRIGPGVGDDQEFTYSYDTGCAP